MTSEYVTRIDWNKLTQPEFDRIVEALIQRQYGADATVVAVNGRGGDGGHDIDVRQPGFLTVYQLKFFPEGFSGGFARSRRRQIKASFIDAMDSQPNRWILVVPVNLTPDERNFVEGLPGQALDSRPEILDRQGLDDLCSRLPDIAAYFTRDRFEHILKLTRTESAAMTDPLRDLPSRAHALAGLTDDATGPDWGLDFTQTAGRTGIMLRAKHPRAHEVCPITLTAAIDPSRMPAEDISVLEYGDNRHIRIVDVKMSITGPEWLNLTQYGELQLGPGASALNPGMLLEFRFDDGSSHSATVTYGGQGMTGYSIRAAIGEAAQLRMTIPRPPASNARLEMSLAVAGVSPADVMRACQLRLALAKESTIELFLGDHRLATARWHEELSADDLAEITYSLTLAEDLDIVQRHGRQYFPIPVEVAAVDRALYRAVRLLLEGHRTTLPLYNKFSPTLKGTDDPPVREWLTSGLCAIRAELDSCNIPIAGRTYRLSPLVVYHPSVEILNAEEAVQRLTDGTATGFEVILKPTNRQDFTALIPGRASAEAQTTLTPWGITGIHERGQDNAEPKAESS